MGFDKKQTSEEQERVINAARKLGRVVDEVYEQSFLAVLECYSKIRDLFLAAVEEPKEVYRCLLAFFNNNEETLKILFGGIFAKAAPEQDAREAAARFIHFLKNGDSEGITKFLLEVIESDEP